MLPFLKPKSVADMIISQRKPSEPTEDKESNDEEDQGLNTAAADLINAIHLKDEASVAAALRAAFDILDSEPHDEGEHTDEQPNDESAGE